jgi:putative ABC transport system permease protein
MTAYSSKIIRDFWQERTRSVLVVFAIAVGIAGFTAVLSAYAVLTRELNRGYLATNPTSATLQTDIVDGSLIQAVLADHDVSDAQARRTINGRLKAGAAEWRNLVLFVVQDYGDIRVGKIDPQQGAWPPGPGEILIERDAMQVARARIGGTVVVRTAAGKEQPLKVSGIVHDVGQAQARMENIVYGYITVATLAQLGESPSLDQLNILVADRRLDEAHIRSVAADVRKLVENRGHSVRRVDIPKPGKHPHADIMGLLLLAMSTFGFAILALSGILVFNLLTGLLASQVRQIGVLKAVGGTRFQIAGIYFAQTVLLGLAATLIGLPLGMFGGRQLCRYLAVFLNFDIYSFSSPVWVYLLVALAGLLVPLLAAAYPVWKGSSIPVRKALADFGVSQSDFGVNVFDRILAGIGGSFRTLLLAIRNSFRRRMRLVLTLATLAAGGVFFMAALNIRASIIHTLDRLFDSRKSDLSVSLGGAYSLEKIERAMRNTAGVVRWEGWIITDGSIPSAGEAASARVAGHSMGSGHGVGAPAGDRFSVVALPPGTMFLRFDIAQGRGLQPGDTDAMVLNTSLAAKRPEMKVGSVVSLRTGPAQLQWRVAGIAREAFSQPVAYISKPYLEKLGGHSGIASTVRLVLDRTDAVSMNSVRASLDHNLEQENIRALASTTKAESRYSFDQHMLMIYVFLIIASSIIAAVGGLGLMTTMSLNVLERRREMGVLRAIGATPKTVWMIVAGEGVLIGVLSWAIAAVMAWPLSKGLGNPIVNLMFQTNLDFVFEIRGLLIWLAVSILLGLGASLLPAWHADTNQARTRTFALAFLMVTALVAAPAEDPVSGNWEASLNVNGDAVPVTFKLKRDADKVAGTFESEHLGRGTLTNGSFTANRLSFTLNSPHGPTEFNGMLNAGKITGEFKAGEEVRGKWEATKKIE